MGLFDKFKVKKEPKAAQPPAEPQAVWDNAFRANINFYQKEGAAPFGAVVLTEGVETALPVAPWEKHGLDGKPVQDWKLVLVSTTRQGIVGMLDYRTVMEKLAPYLQDRQGELMLTRGLSLRQLEGLLK